MCTKYTNVVNQTWTCTETVKLTEAQVYWIHMSLCVMWSLASIINKPRVKEWYRPPLLSSPPSPPLPISSSSSGISISNNSIARRQMRKLNGGPSEVARPRPQPQQSWHHSWIMMIVIKDAGCTLQQQQQHCCRNLLLLPASDCTATAPKPVN